MGAWFVEGLEGGNVGLIQKTHHALVDGVSGVDVATSAARLHPGAPTSSRLRWIVEPPPSPGRLLVDTWYERTTEPAEIARTVGARCARRSGRSSAPAALGARWARSSTATRSPRTSLNVSVGRRRRFEGVQISLDDVKSIRKSLGGTINDVVLAGVSGGLRRLLDVAVTTSTSR